MRISVTVSFIVSANWVRYAWVCRNGNHSNFGYGGHGVGNYLQKDHFQPAR